MQGRKDNREGSKELWHIKPYGKDSIDYQTKKLQFGMLCLLQTDVPE